MSTKNTITYRQIGDYLIPNLELTAEEKEVQIGVWGMRRKNYLMRICAEKKTVRCYFDKIRRCKSR